MNALTDIMTVLTRRVRERGEDVEAWIRRQRLEPLVYGVEVPGLELSESFLAACRQAYFNMTGKAQLFLAESERLVRVLAEAGVPARASRGALFGRELYGDPGLRYFTDLDITVEAADKWRVLTLMEREGYQVRGRWLPRWFLARHHLHWPMIRRDGRIPVDVHWRVDHPYRDLGIGERELAGLGGAARRLVEAVLHAEKESRLRYAADAAELEQRVLWDGPVMPWIDVALMARIDAAAVAEAGALLTRCGSSDVWNRTRWVWRHVLGWEDGHTVPPTPTPGVAAAGWRRAVARSRVAAAVAERLGCRAEALLDGVDYVAARGLGGGWRRWLGVTGRMVRLLLLGVEAVVCGLCMAGESLARRLLRVVPAT